MSHFQHILNIEGAVYKGDRFLAVIRSEQEEHAGGTLAFVGGKVEFSEVCDDIVEITLKREILEEVGVEVDDLRYVTSTGFFSDDGYSVVNMVFVCRWVAGVARAIDPAEVESLQWLTLDAIRQHPKTPIWIQKYVDAIEAMMPSGD